MAEHDWSPYLKGWNGMWFTSKPVATNFATELANLLKLRPASVVVEGKKGEYHVRNAYTNMYWHPIGGWEQEFESHRRAVRRAMDT